MFGFICDRCAIPIIDEAVGITLEPQIIVRSDEVFSGDAKIIKNSHESRYVYDLCPDCAEFLKSIISKGGKNNENH